MACCLLAGGYFDSSWDVDVKDTLVLWICRHQSFFVGGSGPFENLSYFSPLNHAYTLGIYTINRPQNRKMSVPRQSQRKILASRRGYQYQTHVIARRVSILLRKCLQEGQLYARTSTDRELFASLKSPSLLHRVGTLVLPC